METEFKGTPGPWKVGEYPDNDVVFGPDNNGIAWIEDTTASGEEEANTLLIAAAPEMLAALQEIVRQHGLDADNTLLPPIPNRWMDAISKAEKAINKALGR